MPYLSIVTTSRNDNHGGDLNKRMRFFVRSLLYQTRRVKLPCELIMVEWNPPVDKPLMKEVLPKPSEHDYLTIRYIIVPSELHKTYERGDVLPLFQMTAKNVGIQRAKAPFVLCTNVDVIFSNEIFDFLAKKELRKNCFYRANRSDIPADLVEDWEMDTILNYCNKNVMYTLGKNKYIPNLPEEHPVFGRFPKLWRWYDRFVAHHRSRQDKVKYKLNLLDTKACGDFTLMPKEAWIDIQGYPEFDLYSIHIDSLGVMAAIALDYEQVVLAPKERIFHIHHENGWEAFDTMSLMKFINKIPGLDWEWVAEAGAHIIQNKRRFDLNPPNWGFADKTLEEYTLTPNNA